MRCGGVGAGRGWAPSDSDDSHAAGKVDDEGLAPSAPWRGAFVQLTAMTPKNRKHPGDL